jgi:hypothetical protein
MRAKLTPALVKAPLATSAVKEEMDRAGEKGRDRVFVWTRRLRVSGSCSWPQARTATSFGIVTTAIAEDEPVCRVGPYHRT